MSTTIGRLAYQIVADTAQFEKGMALSRKEVNMARKVMLNSKSETEQLGMAQDQLRKLYLKGAIGLKEYYSELRRLESQTESAQEAERQKADAMRRGAQLTRQVETATERYNRELAELQDLQRRGAIGVETYRRALNRLEHEQYQLNRATKMHRMEMLQGIPVIGSLMGSTTLLAGAGLGALTAGFMRVNRAMDESFQQMDKLAKSARKLGLAGQELRELRHAAEQMSGMLGEQFDTALQRMVRRISQAADGSGEAQDAIKELGLEAAALENAGAAEAFLQIADAVKSIENPLDRVRIAQKLFDSEAVDLVNTLSEGRDAILAEMEALRKLQGQISEADLEQIQRTDDAVDDLSKAWTGLWDDWFAGSAKAKEGSSIFLTGLLEDLRGFDDRLKKLQTESALSNFGPFLWAKKVNAFYESYATKAEEAKKEVDELAQQQQRAIDQIKEEGAKLGLTDEGEETDGEKKGKAKVDPLKAHMESLAREAELIGLSADEAERLKLQWMGAGDAQFQMLQTVQKLREQQRLAEEETVRQEAEFERLDQMAAQLMEQFRTPKEQLDDRIAELQQLAARTALDSETLERALKQAFVDFEKARGEAESMREFDRPTIAQQGSQEAARIIQGIQDRDAQDRAKALALQERQNQLQKQVKEELKRMRRENRHAPRLAMAR